MTEGRSSAVQRVLRGRVLYTSDLPGRAGQERGREHFSISVHADGSRTVAAHCEIDEQPPVLREVAYSLDSDWRPTDCFVRVNVGGRFTGTGWFLFHPRYVECETFTAAEGRVSQRLQLDRPAEAFENHAIVPGAWAMRWFDQLPGCVQSLDPLLLSSPDHRGATGPMLFRVGVNVEFLGREPIEVPAGRFDSLHFRFVSTVGQPEQHPPYDLWCTADGEYLFLRALSGGSLQRRYELVELQQT